MAKSMNINLNELTNELFIEANKAFKGSNVAVDSKDKTTLCSLLQTISERYVFR